MGLSMRIALTVRHFELDPSAVTSIRSREGELQLCLAAVQALNACRDSSLRSRTVDRFFRWTFPGLIDQRLSWFSVEETERLDELWRQTLPITDQLPEVNGLFERFETDPFGTYVDVALVQIPNRPSVDIDSKTSNWCAFDPEEKRSSNRNSSRAIASGKLTSPAFCNPNSAIRN